VFIETRKRPIQLRGWYVINISYLLFPRFRPHLHQQHSSASQQTKSTSDSTQHDTWATWPTKMAVIPTWLSLCLRDVSLHSLTASSLPGLLDSLRGIQRRLGRSGEKSRVPAPELSVGHRAHFPRVEAISCGLGGTLKTLLSFFNRHIWSLVVVRVLGRC